MRSRIAITVAIAALAGTCVPRMVRAADATAAGADKLKTFGLASSESGSLPIGRVIVAFLLVAALAWAATWILRRYGYRGATAGMPAAAGVRAVARSTLPGGVTCHVVEAQGRQVLITVTRQGVTSVVLGEPPQTPVAPTISAPSGQPGSAA